MTLDELLRDTIDGAAIARSVIGHEDAEALIRSIRAEAASRGYEIRGAIAYARTILKGNRT
jgi:hypothetical protein